MFFCITGSNLAPPILFCQVEQIKYIGFVPQIRKILLIEEAYDLVAKHTGSKNEEEIEAKAKESKANFGSYVNVSSKIRFDQDLSVSLIS
jgi:hypothetical protein